MCGRARLADDWSEIKIALKFDQDAPAPNYEYNHNLAPTERMMTAIRPEDGKRTPRMMKWGLIPSWAKDTKLQYSRINARSEEFTTKPAFKDAWKRGQRCLCVMTNFYEWKKLDEKGKEKQPTLSSWLTGSQWSWPAFGQPGAIASTERRCSAVPS